MVLSDVLAYLIVERLTRQHSEVSGPDIAAFSDFAAQAKLVRLVSAEASALHTIRFGFNPGDTTGAQGIGV